jgi:hypothetical protein
MTPLIFNCHFTVPSRPGLSRTPLIVLDWATNEKMRGWLRVGAHPAVQQPLVTRREMLRIAPFQNQPLIERLSFHDGA